MQLPGPATVIIGVALLLWNRHRATITVERRLHRYILAPTPFHRDSRRVGTVAPLTQPKALLEDPPTRAPACSVPTVTHSVVRYGLSHVSHDRYTSRNSILRSSSRATTRNNAAATPAIARLMICQQSCLYRQQLHWHTRTRCSGSYTGSTRNTARQLHRSTIAGGAHAATHAKTVVQRRPSRTT